MSLVEKGELISDELKVANSCSNFFEIAVQFLGIKANEYSNEKHRLNNTVETVEINNKQLPNTNLINKILLTVKMFDSY